MKLKMSLDFNRESPKYHCVRRPSFATEKRERSSPGSVCTHFTWIGKCIYGEESAELSTRSGFTGICVEQNREKVVVHLTSYYNCTFHFSYHCVFLSLLFLNQA